MSVAISGILLDPYGNPAPFAEVKFITWQGALDVLTTSSAVYKTSSDGAYSFAVEFGTFTVQVRYNQSNGKFETIKKKVIVNSGTTATTLGELLLFNEPLTPPEIEYVKQLVAEAEGYRNETLTYRNETEVFRDEAEQSAIDAANSAAAVVGVPLNGGVWAAGQTFTAYNQYMIYNGTPYAPLTSTNLPYGPVGAAPDFNFVGPYPLNDHSELSNLDAFGAHSASAIQLFGLESVGDYARKGRHSISFVFDDAYESTKTVLKPLFDTYGLKFGMAVPVGSLGNPSRLTLEGVREMASLGYEIINHATSGDVMNSTAKGKGAVMGELATNWSMLNNIGIKTTGFQTPSSVLDDSYLDVVNQFSDYAFTIGNTQAVLPYNTKADGLYRFSIESATLTECTDVLTELLDSDGGVIFYAHDIANGDDNYLKIVAILDAATANGIPALLPRECVSKSVTPLGNKVRTFNEGVTIDNRVSDFSMSGGASYVVGGNKDITVTIPSSGTFLLQKVVNLTSKDDIDDLINFSALIRDLTGGIVTTASIAIKTYDALDGGGSVLFTTTEHPIDLNNDVVRYYNETIKGGAKSALFYIRLICSAAGSVLVRQPIIRYGSSINPIKFVDNTPVIITSVVPSQSITPDVGYQAVTLTDAANNGLFSVSGNSIVFQKNAVVSVVFSPVASGTNIGVGWIGGASAMLIGGGTTAICPIAGGDNFLAGGSSISIRVNRGYAISFRALASGVALQIGTNSRFVISEI